MRTHTHIPTVHRQNHSKSLALALSLPLLTALLVIGGCAGPTVREAPATLEPFTPLTRADIQAEKIDPIVILIRRTNPSVTPENVTMRAGTSVRPGSSAIISFAGSEFKIDDYSGAVEHYLERALLAAGLQPKDRSKFEEKIRGLKYGSASGTSNLGEAVSVVTERLSKQFAAGEITEQEFIAKAKEARERASGVSANKGDFQNVKNLVYDLSELIGAAKDGVERADYILQVTKRDDHGTFRGKPLNIENRPEVLAAIGKNPGLRIGDRKSRDIPKTIQTPWMYARVNAKLFSVETGSIDWAGEYSVESPAVLDDGATITIPLRRTATNEKRITDVLNAYNNRVSALEREAVSARTALENAYSSRANQKIIAAAESRWKQTHNNYEKARRQIPSELDEPWEFDYLVGDPILRPDFLQKNNLPESVKRTLSDSEQLELKREVDDHVKALYARVTRDLMKSINIK